MENPDRQDERGHFSSPVLKECSRTQVLLEVGVVLILGVIPAFCSSLWWLIQRTPEPTFLEDSIFLTIRSLQVSAPVLYIIYRGERAWNYFGLGRPEPVLDGITAFVLLSVEVGFYALFLSYLQTLFPGEYYKFPEPCGSGEYLLLVVMHCANGFAEELVMRGYLIPRLEELLNSTGWSIFITSVLFASYHLYQGPGASLNILVMGIFYGIAFAAIRRIWPLALAHAFWNILVTVA